MPPVANPQLVRRDAAKGKDMELATCTTCHGRGKEDSFLFTYECDACMGFKTIAASPSKRPALTQLRSTVRRFAAGDFGTDDPRAVLRLAKAERLQATDIGATEDQFRGYIRPFAAKKHHALVACVRKGVRLRDYEAAVEEMCEDLRHGVVDYDDIGSDRREVSRLFNLIT
ncbi:MAG: hypothetical protein RLZZ324_749 [Candidatus Parcubacteria bacterium]|jgi:hypothetical protein